MMDSWGLKEDEPYQMPRSVLSSEQEPGLFQFRRGRAIPSHSLSSPIKMVWERQLFGGGLAWEMFGSPSDGPRSQRGVRRKWAYMACDPPLMHRDLVMALRSAGADTIEDFAVEIMDEETDEVCDDFLAINIVGLVAAADLGRSSVVLHDERGLIDADFDSLSLDDHRIKGRLLFRLAESVNAVVVEAHVKSKLEALGGFELTFAVPESWIG